MARGASPEFAFRAYQSRQVRINARIKWFGEQVIENMQISQEKKLDIAAQLMRDKVVANIARPVERRTGPRGGKQVIRSSPGEFPRADTTRLMKDIFWDKRGPLKRIIGTTLDYGVFLEFSLNRSFLRRTLDEEQAVLRKILTRKDQ